MMLLNKLSNREKKILYVVILLLGVLVGYHGAFVPLSQKFTSIDEEIFALQMKIRKGKIYLRQRDEIHEEAKKYPNLEQMDAGSDEEEIAKLLNFIEQTARAAGVSISDVKPQAVQSDKIVKRYSVELNAESTLDQLVSFSFQLEHSPQLLKIEQVNTSPKDEKASGILRSYIVVTRVVVK
jgi:Tfp pilus assembly protein PilO